MRKRCPRKSVTREIDGIASEAENFISRQISKQSETWKIKSSKMDESGISTVKILNRWEPVLEILAEANLECKYEDVIKM